MSVSLDAVAAISRAVAADEDRKVERITVASVSAEANRVELLVILAPPAFEPRRVLLNLNRKEPVAFERQLRAKLHEVLNPRRSALALVSREQQG
jgi:hypothetical protein